MDKEHKILRVGGAVALVVGSFGICSCERKAPSHDPFPTYEPSPTSTPKPPLPFFPHPTHAESDSQAVVYVNVASTLR